MKWLKHPITLCLGASALAFLLGLYCLIPLEPFVRQLEQQAARHQVKLVITQPGRLLLPGLKATAADLSSPRISHPPLQLKNLRLTPHWSGLLIGNPGIRFSFTLFDGRVEGYIQQDGQLQLQLAGLRIDEPLNADSPLRLQGAAQQGEYSGRVPLAGNNKGDLKLKAREIKIDGLQTLGAGENQLDLGTLILVARSEGAQVELARLQLESPTLSLQGTGTLRIAHDPTRSTINLNLLLTPGETLDPKLKELLSLLKPPQQDGSYALRLSGQLSNPRLN